MNKIVFVIGSEFFVNNTKVQDVRNMSIYVIYFEHVKLSYNNAIDLINYNTVLFIKSINKINIPNGDYTLDSYAININNKNISLMCLNGELPLLCNAIKIKFPIFSSDFYYSVVINNIYRYSIFFGCVVLIIWLILYYSYYLKPVDLYERALLIKSINNIQ